MPGPIHGFNRRRRLNVRHRLLRDLALLIVAATAAIFLLGVFATSTVQREMSEARIREVRETAVLEYDRASAPVDRILLIARRWGEAGLLAPSPVADLDRLLIPVFEEMPQLAGLSIASTRGDSYFLARDGDGWLTRTRDAGTDGPFLTSHWSADGKRLGEKSETLAYDPRTRPWFQGALETPDGIHDTQPYTFFTSGRPGITSSVQWTDRLDPGTTWVIGADFLLRELGNFIGRMRLGHEGKAFLLRPDGMLFQPPEQGTATDDYFVAPDRIADPVVARAVAAWPGAGPSGEATFQFTADGKDYWAGFQPLEKNNRSVWLGVVIGEVDFFGAVWRWRADLLLLDVLILLGAIGLATVLVRKYRHQLRDLPMQPLGAETFEEDVLALIREGESDTLEFKSTVRANLATGKPGKEIELAWLKSVVGFMNSDGGTVLIGIDDAGEPVGIEADGFANEDKCRLHLKNLVNEHIGADLSPFVNFRIGTVHDRTVVAVECERCPRPVFLTGKGKEAFYIRSGPSSVELSPSEVLGYVKQRR